MVVLQCGPHVECGLRVLVGIPTTNPPIRSAVSDACVSIVIIVRRCDSPQVQ